jgi:ubiquitin-like protein Pup
MADQTRKPKPREDEQVETAEETQAEAQTDEVDDLLDEIDEVLEANAEEFVRSYVQKGGQ